MEFTITVEFAFYARLGSQLNRDNILLENKLPPRIMDPADDRIYHSEVYVEKKMLLLLLYYFHDQLY